MIQLPLIEIKGVEFSYKNIPSLFKDLSFNFIKGKFYLIKGPSGIGKTSLLKLLNRLDDPIKGELWFKGKPYKEYYPPKLRSKILYIHQTPIATNASVEDNLLFPFSFKNNCDYKIPHEDELISYLNNFKLNDVSLEKNAQTLSVGQLQRICFIRGLLLDPDVILLDEPTSALDDESAKIVEQKAEHFCTNSEKTVIMISHKRFTPETI